MSPPAALFPQKCGRWYFENTNRRDFSTKSRLLEKESGIQLPRWYSLPVFSVRKKDVCKSNSYRETDSIEVSLISAMSFSTILANTRNPHAKVFDSFLKQDRHQDCAFVVRFIQFAEL